MIEKVGDKLSINLVYGNTIKITLDTFCSYQQTKFFDKLKERYELWEIAGCACKPKKIRAQLNGFEGFQYTIDHLKWISNKSDVKLGIYIDCKCYTWLFPIYDKIVFNHSTLRCSNSTYFMFSGDTLAAVYDGNYYNFRLDQRTKESEDCYIKGKI